MSVLDELDQEVRLAVKQAWADEGGMGHFEALVERDLREAGISASAIQIGQRRAVIPGYFRPTTRWDLLVVHEGAPVAAVDFMSDSGSFGSQYDVQAGDALAKAIDVAATYRAGTFAPSWRPWIGRVLLFQQKEGADGAVEGSANPRIKVREEFRGTPDAEKYASLALKLVREGHYDAVSYLTSPEKGGKELGDHDEPGGPETTMRRFLGALTGYVRGVFAEASTR